VTASGSSSAFAGFRFPRKVCTSSASSQPCRGTTSEARNATNGVATADNPVFRAAAPGRDTPRGAAQSLRPIEPRQPGCGRTSGRPRPPAAAPRAARRAAVQGHRCPGSRPRSRRGARAAPSRREHVQHPGRGPAIQRGSAVAAGRAGSEPNPHAHGEFLRDRTVPLTS